MQFITRDYETYYASDYTLSNMSTSEYVFDKRFEVIMVSVKINDGKTVWMEEAQWRKFAQSADWSKIGLLGHHNHFDGLIDSYYYGVRPAFWFDTLSMSRAITGPRHKHSLEVLAKRWEVGEKGKEVVNARGKRRCDFTPAEIAVYGGYCINDTDLTLAIFKKMMAKGFPQSELELIDTTIRMFTEPSFILDEVKMREYHIDEQRRKREFIQRVASEYAHITKNEPFDKFLSSSDKFAKLLVDRGIDPPTKQGKNEIIFAFATTDPGFQELLEHEDDEVRWLAEARRSVKSTINETRTGRLLLLGADGRPMPVYHNHYGTHTGRTSGGDKVNFSNFERTDKRNPRKGTIRKSIRPPKGHKIVVVDSGQIEARFNAWLAGHSTLVKQFASGVDVYSAFASRAFGRPVDRKNVAEDQIPGHIGKCMVLGLGYGMGWYKFAMEMLKGMNGGPVVQFTAYDIEKIGVDVGPFLANPDNVKQIIEMPSRLALKDRLIHCAVANHFVTAYRESELPITHLWDFHERVIKDMTEGRQYAFHYLGFLQLEEAAIRLPNRMQLKYDNIKYGPIIKKGETEGKSRKGYTFFDGRSTKKIYGGLLTENLVQALTRIIVTDQSTMLKKRGYRIATWSYDELVMVVPDSQAEECLHDALEVMKIAPVWAPGLPLAAEGGIGDTYGEAKH